jgi:hypothetical protein
MNDIIIVCVRDSPENRSRLVGIRRLRDEKSIIIKGILYIRYAKGGFKKRTENGHPLVFPGILEPKPGFPCREKRADL